MTTYGRAIPSVTIELQRGNAETILFQFRDDAGAALDLTGKTLVFSASYPGGPTFSKQTGDADFVMASPATGEATLSFTAAETRSLPRLAARNQVASVPFEVENFTDELTLVEGVLVGTGEAVNSDA